MRTDALELAIKQRKAKRIVGQILTYLILTIFAFAIIVPFWYLITTSFKVGSDVSAIPVKWFPWITFDPIDPLFENFKLALLDSYPSLLTGLVNTMKIAIPSVLFCLLTSVFAAYGFAKIKMRFSGLIFNLLLFNMMIPAVVVLVPQFMLFQEIGWVNTILPLVVPISFGSINCIFFLRQSMSGIPNELIESARIDGLGEPMIVLRIMAPLIVPAIVTQVILVFISIYNDYMGPLIYLTDSKNYTIQLSVESLQGSYGGNTEVVIAGSLLALIPTVALFFGLQKFYISGIAVTGLKG